MQMYPFTIIIWYSVYMSGYAMGWKRQGLKKTYPCNAEQLQFYRKRRGWTQDDLESKAGYSTRLISKAEAGQSISTDTIADLAEALSSPKELLFPEDLISDPLSLAKAFIGAISAHQKEVIQKIRHIIDDDIIIHMSGDLKLLPFAGEYCGIEEAQRFFNLFFSILEVPPNYDADEWYTYVADGNDVIVWGVSWIHPIGQPLDKPIKVANRLKFQRGKLILFDDRYDTHAGYMVIREEES